MWTRNDSWYGSASGFLKCIGLRDEELEKAKYMCREREREGGRDRWKDSERQTDRQTNRKTNKERKRKSLNVM